MKNIFGQQLSEDMEKLYRYAVAPDGGLREAKMLAKANDLGREFNDSISIDTSVITLIEHAVPKMRLNVGKRHELTKPLLRVSLFPMDKAYIKNAVQQGFYSIDIDVLFYAGFFGLGFKDLIRYQNCINNRPTAMQAADFPCSKVSLLIAGERPRISPTKEKLMREYSQAVVTDELIRKFKKYVETELLRDYCTPNWSMIKFIFHH